MKEKNPKRQANKKNPCKNLVIRIAGEQDIKTLTSLFNKSSFLRSTDSLEVGGYNEKEIGEYMENKDLDYFIVCEINNEIAGALLAEFRIDYVYLDIVIVDPQFHCKGIGSRLLDSFDAEVKKRKAELIEVLVEEDNLLMKKIMENRGYKPTKLFRYFVKVLN